MSTISDAGILKGLVERQKELIAAFKKDQEEIRTKVPGAKPDVMASPKKKDLKAGHMTIEEIFSGPRWNSVDEKIMAVIRDQCLPMLSPDNMATIPYDQREGFRKEVYETIEAICQDGLPDLGLVSKRVNNRWYVTGIERDLKEENGRNFSHAIFAKMLKLNGHTPDETIVELVTPEEADRLDAEMELCHSAFQRRERVESWPAPVYAVQAKHEFGTSMGRVLADATGTHAVEYARNGRIFFKICTDRRLQSEYYLLARYLGNLLRFHKEDVERDQLCYGRVLGYYGVRKGVNGPTIAEIVGGATGARSVFIHERYPVRTPVGTFQGAFILRGITAEGMKCLGYELSENRAAVQIVVHESSDMFEMLARRYKAGENALYPVSRDFRQGSVLEITMTYLVDVHEPFFGLVNAKTGQVDDMVRTILLYALKGEQFQRQRQEQDNVRNVPQKTCRDGGRDGRKDGKRGGARNVTRDAQNPHADEEF